MLTSVLIFFLPLFFVCFCLLKFNYCFDGQHLPYLIIVLERIYNKHQQRVSSKKFIRPPWVQSKWRSSCTYSYQGLASWLERYQDMVVCYVRVKTSCRSWKFEENLMNCKQWKLSRALADEIFRTTVVLKNI